MKLKVVISIVLILFQTLVYGQDSQLLKFSKGQEIVVVNNVSQNITSMIITEKDFEATLISVGKANPLDGEVIYKLKSRNKRVYYQVRKITTAFELVQGDNKFYIRGLNSINLAQFRNGKFKVKCHIYLLKIRSKDGISYIPIITSIRKI